MTFDLEDHIKVYYRKREDTFHLAISKVVLSFVEREDTLMYALEELVSADWGFERTDPNIPKLSTDFRCNLILDSPTTHYLTHLYATNVCSVVKVQVIKDFDDFFNKMGKTTTDDLESFLD